MKSILVIILLFLNSPLIALANCSQMIELISKNARLHATKIAQQTAVILAVRKTFETLKNDPDVLPEEMLVKNKKFGIKSVGFGYSATRAVYHLLGGKNAKLTPMMAKNPRAGSWEAHWWIRDNTRGINIDPTHDQLEPYSERLSYSAGKPVDFDSQPLSIATEKIILKAAEILKQKGLQPNGLPESR